MIKKYIIGASISLVLLLALFLFGGHDLNKNTGNSVYSIPQDSIVLDVVSNNIPNYFCANENKFSGNFSFKFRGGVFLPTSLFFGLMAKDSATYSETKAMPLETFMASTSPFISTVLVGGDQIGVAGGIATLPSFNIYNTTDPEVLANTYTTNTSIFDLTLPVAGEYIYFLNISADENLGFYVASGTFSVVDRNCTLGLNNIQINVSDNTKFYAGKNINCSAKVDGKFFSDLSKSRSKINFSLFYEDGTSFVKYRTLSGSDSGVVCNIKNSCSAIFSVSETHLGNWKCSITVDDGKTMITKNSLMNITMIIQPVSVIKNISNLTFSGGFEEEFLSLTDYFSGTNLIYTYVNLAGNKINLSINSNGDVNITSPYEINLSESFYFIVSDGINSIQSNVFSITISESGLSNSNGGCSPNWTYTEWSDCESGGVRTRIVFDTNSCTGNITIPSETESCDYSSGEPLQSNSPETQLPQNFPETKKASIFDNKLLLTGMVLGFFLLLVLILLLLDRLKKNKEKNLIKPKEKPKEETHAEYKPKFETPVKQVREEVSIVNTSELNKYIRDMLNKGASIDSVKEKLISSGWKKEQVEEAVNFVRIKDFVDSMLEKGQSRENIRKLLKEKGWKDNIIDKILK